MKNQSSTQTDHLKKKHIVEFVALSERAVNEGLSSKEIKQNIKNWRADEYRV